MIVPIPTSDIAVLGAGPAGLVTALALAHIGARVALVAPRPSPAQLAADTRSFAALGGSIDFLRRLGVWADLEPATAPLRAIRIVDDRGGLLRAPEVLFAARDLDLDAFGANIPHAAMGLVLAATVDATPSIRWVETTVTRIVPGRDAVTLTLANAETLSVPVVAAADGRRSIARDAADIPVSVKAYPQTAIACVFGHGRPHHGVSTEFHSTIGPVTTVPMPDDASGPRSSLVWVTSHEEAATLTTLDDAAFRNRLSERLQGLLGRLGGIGPRAAFPLEVRTASTVARMRIALVGEAGHVLPPIGAQGLNLSLRDAATLAERIQAALSSGQDPGAEATLSRYAAARAADVWARTTAIDLLNQTLISTALPFDVARGVGLHALAASAALRRMAMRQGLEPVGERPRLMQG
jgi:2-octaprenyl-6-methoxyphenol hydroxylase